MLKLKRPFLGTVDFGAGQIGRQQIWGKLDAVKIGLNPAAQDIDGPGLGKAWGTLDQEVAVCQEGHQHALNETFLTNHLSADVVLKVLNGLLGLGQAGGRLLLFLSHEKVRLQNGNGDQKAGHQVACRHDEE